MLTIDNRTLNVEVREAFSDAATYFAYLRGIDAAREVRRELPGLRSLLRFPGGGPTGGLGASLAALYTG